MTPRAERILVAGCLAAIVLLSWVYLLDMARDMAGMDLSGEAPSPAMAGLGEMADMAVASPTSWGLADVLSLFVMWAVMMVAMMVPSAMPMTLAFLGVSQRRRTAGRPAVPTCIFVLGYVGIWTVYSAAAALAQWGLHEAALISADMVVTSAWINGGLLVAAGVFQWTPLKRACLTGCRSPLAFLMGEWREGPWGAFRMGLRHGSYCVGCCWILMALLFVTGVMNLLWVAVIAAFVLLEKVVPRGALVGHVAGAALVGAGIFVMTSAGVY